MFLSGGVEKSPVLLLLQRLFGFFVADFLLHAQKKLGGKEVRIQFCGVENSNEVDSCLYVEHSEFKRSTSLTPEISVNQLVELQFLWLKFRSV